MSRLKFDAINKLEGVIRSEWVQLRNQATKDSESKQEIQIDRKLIGSKRRVNVDSKKNHKKKNITSKTCVRC